MVPQLQRTFVPVVDTCRCNLEQIETIHISVDLLPHSQLRVNQAKFHLCFRINQAKFHLCFRINQAKFRRQRLTTSPVGGHLLCQQTFSHNALGPCKVRFVTSLKHKTLLDGHFMVLLQKVYHLSFLQSFSNTHLIKNILSGVFLTFYSFRWHEVFERSSLVQGT